MYAHKFVKLIFVALILLDDVVASGEKDDYCENNPSYEYRSASLHPDAYQLLTNQSLLHNVMHIGKQYNHNRSVYIFHVTGTREGQESIICTTPKSGSTRIRMILKKIQEPSYNGTKSEELYDPRYYDPVERKSAQDLEQLLQNSSIPRYAIVRDPYARAISMYSNKIVRQDKDAIEWLQMDSHVLSKLSFGDFVQIMYDRSFGHKLNLNMRLDRHFISQSSLCGFDLGMTYNYVLKQEDMNDWFDCFIDDVNARQEVMHGWPQKNDCYFSTERNPCNGPRMVDGKLVNLDKAIRTHHTNSSDYIEMYYKNRTIAKLVTELFKDDIFNFGYPILL